MPLNIGDKKTKLLLSLAKTPLFFYPHYKYHLPLPSVMMIENTNHCNAECVMCPRELLSRKGGFMDLGLFEKIIREVSGLKRKPVTHLHGFGEPMLDKLLPERIRLAKAYGITHTYIVSNASLLSPETSRKIIDAGLDKMKVSFYGTDEESYNTAMKRLDFKVTFQNIKDFLRIRKEMKRRHPRLILQYLAIEANRARTDEFRTLWGPLIDKKAGDCLNVTALHNLHGLQRCSGPRGSQLPDRQGSVDGPGVNRRARRFQEVPVRCLSGLPVLRLGPSALSVIAGGAEPAAFLPTAGHLH